MASALIGTPPHTQEDYYIVLGIFRRFGFKGDPAQGAKFPPARPVDDHYHSRGPGYIGEFSVLIFLTVFIVGSRLLIRALSRAVKWGWDDWLIIPAALLVLIWFSIQIAKVMYGGNGKHIWDVTYKEFDLLYRASYVAQIIYLPAAILIKMSIVLFNRRITGLASKTWRRINDGFLVLLVVYMIVYSIWIGLRCPINRLGFSQVGKMKNPKFCPRSQGLKLTLGLASIHVGLGFCLLLTPIIVLWKVKMKAIKKVQLFFIFAVGSVSCICALMLVVTQFQVTQDITYNSARFSTLIALDLFFGVTVSCLPVLAGQLPKTWSKVKSFTGSHGRSQGSQRDPTHRGAEAGSRRKGGEVGKYGEEDPERQPNMSRVEDSVELLRQPSQPNMAMIRGHPPLTSGGYLDFEFSKQVSRNESLESTATATATPPLETKH